MAANTRSASRGGSLSGHLSMAWYETPISLAAEAVDPPSSSMAFALSIPPLNHGSTENATEVQTNGGTVSTVVEEYKDRLTKAMSQAGFSTQALADALGISYQAVRKVLEGGKFGTTNNAKAAKVLQVNSDWLATGRGPMKGTSPGRATSDGWPSEEIRQKAVRLKPKELSKLDGIIRAYLDLPSVVVDAQTASNNHPQKRLVTARQVGATVRNHQSQDGKRSRYPTLEDAQLPNDGDGHTQDHGSKRTEGGGDD